MSIFSHHSENILGDPEEVVVGNLGLNTVFYFCIFLFSDNSLSIYWISSGREPG